MSNLLPCAVHVTLIVCFDYPIASKNNDVNKHSAFTFFLFDFYTQQLNSHKEIQPKSKQPLKWPGCKLSISAGLKSSAIPDEAKRVLCPFQEDCLVKLDYIS